MPPSAKAPSPRRRPAAAASSPPLIDSLVDRAGASAIPVHTVSESGYARWLAARPKGVRAWLESTEFRAKTGRVALVPSGPGRIGLVVLGLGAERGPWPFAALRRALPRGRYQIAAAPDGTSDDDVAFGWAMGGYEFTRYRKPQARAGVFLVWPKSADRAAVTDLVEATALGRDLINTPAEDMGPEQLSAVASALARAHGGKVREIVGDALLRENFPLIHAVGRAAARSPRLIDLTWGSPNARKLTLVGKGVCFDTGGLDLKTGGSMKMMKKDMGGAATVLALARLIMGRKLPVRLRVLIPAVENAVSGNAIRPLDVVRSRKGLTVEIGNTDAEGRLVLADALDEASRERPELLLDIATLTGAARVALGTDLPALFCDDDAFTASVLAHGIERGDPLWRMPLHGPYRSQLDSKVADLCNIGGSYGGAITAALFLREFVGAVTVWAHVDSMAWINTAAPGRPVGGEPMGLRGLWGALAARFGG